uniref:Long-chain fatty acid--CoA ligase n=1 Tax=uncultured bacterium 20 TaxID=1748270 RepID=A0A0U3T2K8_9BACT|nr:long-chain fatty acid--CoA ligase [uncultured bacterium 20]
MIERTPEAYGYPLLVRHLLERPLVCAPEQEIVYRNLVRYDYRTLRRRVGRLAGALARLGVEPGDTVAVMDWDSHRYLECYFAVPMMGAVLQTVNVRLSSEQVLYTLNHAAATVILVHFDFLPVLEEIADGLETAHTFVLLVDGGVRPATTCRFAAEYEEMLEASWAEYPFEDFDEYTRATTFYTTGTTGLPKGVYFSHRQLVLHTLATMAALGLSERRQRFHSGDVYMPITPMFHVHAWGLPYVATVMGVKQVYPGRYSPEVLAGLIEREGVTFSHCVPTLLRMLLTCPAASDVDLSGLTMVIGGSALPKGLARAAMERGIDVFTGYGMSETCPILTLAQLKPGMADLETDEQVEVRTTAGLPVPLVDLRLVDEDMNDVPRDGKTAGEIVVRTPWLTQGYLDDAVSSKRLWRGGYLHTNDLAVMDSDGYLRITDRIKDVIKTGGEWISSLELESLISQHEGVSEVAVIGVRDETWGERPLALTVLKPDYADRVTEDDIKAHVRGYAERGVVSRWAVPDRVRFVAAIAKTGVGKIDKKTLREVYES